MFLATYSVSLLIKNGARRAAAVRVRDYAMPEMCQRSGHAGPARRPIQGRERQLPPNKAPRWRFFRQPAPSHDPILALTASW
jgi:hypothetical protein